MTPFTAVFQYCRFFASPEGGCIGRVDCTTINFSKSTILTLPYVGLYFLIEFSICRIIDKLLKESLALKKAQWI